MISIATVPSGNTQIRWTPVPHADGYVVEIQRSNGQWGWVAVIDGGNETTSIVSWPVASKFRVRAFNAAGFSDMLARRRAVSR